MKKIPEARNQKRRPERNILSRKKTETDAICRIWKQDLFVGSGVVEAGCKNIIGARLKQSGMEWTVRGANAIISAMHN